MKTVFVATPTYDGKVHAQYALALSDTQMLLSQMGVKLISRIHCGGSLLVAERNRLITEFLESQCTHLMFIDSDIGFPPLAISKFLNYDLPFIAACYPARGEKTFIFRSFENEDKSLIVDETKTLVKMQYIPAGFMMIKRELILKLCENNPDLYYEPKDTKNKPGYMLFNTTLRDKEFWGEDYEFCRLIRENGFDIWVDPSIQLDHAGNIGSLSEILTSEKPIQNV